MLGTVLALWSQRIHRRCTQEAHNLKEKPKSHNKEGGTKEGGTQVASGVNKRAPEVAMLYPARALEAFDLLMRHLSPERFSSSSPSLLP